LQDRVAATGDAFVSKARNVAARLPEDVAGQAMAAVETAVREAERVQGARLDLPRRVNEALANFREHMTQAQQADLDRAWPGGRAGAPGCWRGRSTATWRRCRPGSVRR
jgi:hypothetical protein